VRVASSVLLMSLAPCRVGCTPLGVCTHLSIITYTIPETLVFPIFYITIKIEKPILLIGTFFFSPLMYTIIITVTQSHPRCGLPLSNVLVYFMSFCPFRNTLLAISCDYMNLCFEKIFSFLSYHHIHHCLEICASQTLVPSLTFPYR
jgi:hypothetical protein